MRRRSGHSTSLAITLGLALAGAVACSDTAPKARVPDLRRHVDATLGALGDRLQEVPAAHRDAVRAGVLAGAFQGVVVAAYQQFSAQSPGWASLLSGGADPWLRAWSEATGEPVPDALADALAQAVESARATAPEDGAVTDLAASPRVRQAVAMSELNEAARRFVEGQVAERLGTCVGPVRPARILYALAAETRAGAVDEAGLPTDLPRWSAGFGYYRGAMRLIVSTWDFCDEVQRAAIQSQLLPLRRVERLWPGFPQVRPALGEEDPFRTAQRRLARLVLALGDLGEDP